MAGRETKKVLVTRAEPAASRTAGKLSEAGFEPMVFPLFEVSDTCVTVPVSACDAYLFTSANAVEILKKRGWKCPDPKAHAYCVGEQTGSLVASLGFSDVISADGTAYDLANTVKNKFSGKPGQICYFAGEQRSFDMDAALAVAEIVLETIEIYRIVHHFPPENEVRSVMEALGDGLVMLYSAKTAKHVCETLFSSSKAGEEKSLRAITISAKTRDTVLKYPWGQVYVSHKPNEQSMIRQLMEISLA